MERVSAGVLGGTEKTSSSRVAIAVLALVSALCLFVLVYLVRSVVDVEDRAVAAGREVVDSICSYAASHGELPATLDVVALRGTDFSVSYRRVDSDAYRLAVVVDDDRVCVYESEKNAWRVVGR